MKPALHRRILFCDWHMPEFLPAITIDLDAYFAGVRRSGAQTLIFMTKSAHGNCLYPSDVGFTNRALRGDLFGEVCRRTRAAGLQCIAYYNMTLSYNLVPLHPEWRQVDRAGQPTTSCAYPVFCMSNPEFRAFTVRHVAEIAERYKVDGFFFDVQYFAPDGCFCPACREIFRSMFGYALDPGAFTTAAPWLDFYSMQVRVREDYIHAAREAAASARSGLSFSWNGCGKPDSLSASLADGADYLSTEAHPPGYLRADYGARYCQGQGKPFTLFMPESQGSWGDWTLTTAATMKGLSAIALAHGGSLNINHVPYPCGDRGGFVPAPVWDTVAETFAWVKEREPFCSGRSVPVAACLHSPDNVRLLRALGRVDATAHLAGETSKAETALLQLMLESHIPLDIRPASLTLEELSAYEMLILPYMPYVDDALAETLRAYVHGGGCLLAAYHTSLLDERGAWRDNFTLADLFGVDYQCTSEYSISYLDLPDPAVAAAIPDMPLLIKTEEDRKRIPRRHALCCCPRPGTRTLATLMDPVIESDFARGHHVYHDHAPPGTWTDYPGAVVNRFGQGLVAYFPVPFFQAFQTKKSPYLKALFQSVLTDVLGVSQRIRIAAPLSVKAALMQDGEGWLLHLIHAQMQTDGMYLDPFARPEKIRVQVNTGWPVADVIRCPAGETLAVHKDGQWMVFESACPRDHDILRIRRAARS